MSLIQFHLIDYACSVWYTGLTNSMKLQVTQNKLIMFILDLNLRANVGHQHFQSLNLLPVNKRVEQIILCHMFKIKHKLAPAYMDYHLVLPDTVHSTRLSQRGGFIMPTVKCSGSKSSFIGAKLWNTLPTNISDIDKLQSFKVFIKSHLIKYLNFLNCYSA